MKTYPKIIIILFIILNSILWAVDELLFDDTTLRLEGEIKRAVRRQVIYAHNIANANIEGFKPIRFDDELAELQARPGWSEENDEVSVEEEMAKMTKNRFKHQTYLRLYNLKMQTLKTVVKQGKG